MVQVTVKEGILEGVKVNNEFGGTFYSFKGIPYAEPPIGDLRFKAPRPLKPWKGVRKATEHGSVCYQCDPFFNTPAAGSEDCLYLNVYTPDIKPTKLLPVMFYIHGGAFLAGSGNDDFYGPEFLVRHDVILVTFNYRLEVLGFLSLDTEDIPGNAGMKDQVAALRWVKENIKNFGGDTDNITIFGESAGGVSVSYHLISPMTKGLFKKAIIQSGAATNSWAIELEPRARAKALAKKLGCDSNDDKELYEFFKSQPIEALVNINVPITLSEEASEFIDLQFTIVSERKFGNNERFFYGDAYNKLREGIHEGVEVIAGFCEDEGIVGLGRNINIEKWISQANAYPEIMVPKEIAVNCPRNVVLEVGTKIKQFYFGNQQVSMDNFDLWVKFLSMSMFKYGIYQWQSISSLKNRVYLYNFSCQSKRNFFGNLLGADKILKNGPFVSHGDDVAYLFPVKFLGQQIDTNSETFSKIETVTKLWTNFAKTGDPTPDFSLGAEWPPYEQKYQGYLNIGNTLTVNGGPNKELEFWESIFKEYYPDHVC